MMSVHYPHVVRVLQLYYPHVVRVLYRGES